MPTVRLVVLVVFSFAVTACGGDGDPPARPDAAEQVDPDAPPVAPSCSDGELGEDETDVDCGGGCGATCAIDDTCADSDDCADGLVCDRVTEADDAPRGCRPRVDSCVGDPCDADAYCAVWSLDDTGAIYACSLRIPLGGECLPTGGTGDRAVNPCVAGAACAEDPEDPFAHVGSTALPEGAACEDYECADGLGCRGGTCTPLTADGGDCLNTSECELDSYCAGPSGVCTPRVDAGAICYDLEAGCATGLDCAFPPSLACTSWLDCGSNMMCCGTSRGVAICADYDGSGPVCEPPRGTCE
jgi:hypothetical protein